MESQSPYSHANTTDADLLLQFSRILKSVERAYWYAYANDPAALTDALEEQFDGRLEGNQ